MVKFGDADRSMLFEHLIEWKAGDNWAEFLIEDPDGKWSASYERGVPSEFRICIDGEPVHNLGLRVLKYELICEVGCMVRIRIRIGVDLFLGLPTTTT